MFLIPFMIFVSSAFADEQCVPAREEIKVPHDGQYHRIHPSGEAFMYTDNQTSVIVDMSDRSHPKFIRTPMREEAYPVESSTGGWDLIAAPVNGGGRGPKGGTEFFKYKDLTAGESSQAKAAYIDDDHGQYYLSAATLPGESANSKKVRTLLYSNRLYRDYEMTTNSDGTVSATKGEPKQLCANIFKKEVIPPEKMRKFEEAKNQAQENYRLVRSKAQAEPDRDKRYKMLEEAEAKYNQEVKAAEEVMYGPDYVIALKNSLDLEKKVSAASKELLESEAMLKFRDRERNLYEKQNIASEKVRTNEQVRAVSKKVNELDRERYRAIAEGRATEKMNEEYNAAIAEYKKVVAEKTQESGLRELVKETRKLEAEKLNHINTTALGKKFVSLSESYETAKMRVWELKGGLALSNPILSKDGEYVGGMVGSSLNVYKIDASGNCTLAAKTGLRGSKVSFNYSSPSQPPKFVFTAEGGGSGKYSRGAFLYDMATKNIQSIAKDTDEAYYPGFTKDGRVMFKSDDDMVIVDPNQLDGSTAKCIKKSHHSSAVPNSDAIEGNR